MTAQRGFVMIAALVILMALTVMGIAMINTSTLESRIAGLEKENAQATFLCEAGFGQVRAWFQYPERFTPSAGDYSFALSNSPTMISDCITSIPDTSATGIGMQSCQQTTGSFDIRNFFRRRYVENNKREYIFNATQYSQFADVNGDGTQDSFNTTDGAGSDKPALAIFGANYLNNTFDDYKSVGKITRIEIYPPMANPKSGPSSLRPRPLCTVRVTAQTTVGITKTIESEVYESIFLTIDAGAEAGAAASWNGSGTINWGKVLVKGNVDINLNQIRKKCNGAVPLTWDAGGDPWFKARITGTFNPTGPFTPNICNPMDCIALEFGCEGIYNGSAPGKPYQDFNLYENQTVELDNWDNSDMSEYAEGFGSYYKVINVGAQQRVFKSNRNGDQLSDPVTFNDTWLLNNNDPFLYIDASTATGQKLDLQVGGTFHREGDIFINGSLDIGGGGNGEDIPVLDPGGASQTLNDINFRGVLYMTGSLQGSGSPNIFGAVVAEGGLQSAGNPTVWYDRELAEGRRSLPKSGKGMWRELM